MKLNIIKNICMGGLILLSATSCSDFLEEKPEGSMDASKYFTTKDGYEYLVKGGYEPVRWVTRRTDTYLFGTDVYTVPGRGLDYGTVTNKDEYSKTYLRGANEYFKTSIDASSADFKDTFKDAFILIQRANTIIAYGQRADITETLRNQRVGEAKFLRALGYYYLVEQFSDIPLLTEEITVPHFTAERTPEKDIYAFLIKDLEDCFSTIASKSDQPEFGRVTRGAIKTLLSKLYLTRSYKSYAESNDATRAYELATDVISNEGYKLLDNFGDIFKEGNEQNDEIIFSVQYSEDQQTNWSGNTDYSTFQPFLYAIAGMGAKSEFLERYMGRIAPARAAYLMYDRTWDKRFDETFQREYFANEAKPAESGAFGEITVGQKMIHCVFPDEHQMTRAEKDALPYFVVNFDEYADQPLVGGVIEADGDYRVNGYTRDSRYYVYPGIKKFRDSKARYSDGGEQGTRDHFEMRLGEVYLIAAEASLKAGSGDGAGYLQRLRNRAAISGTAPALALTIDNILDERARELMGEERRFLDLKRTGLLRERVFTRKMNERAVRALEVHGPELAFKDEYLTRPLPYDWTITLRNVVEQNPGYDY